MAFRSSAVPVLTEGKALVGARGAPLGTEQIQDMRDRRLMAGDSPASGVRR